jgi:hypothetical protein
MPLASVGLVTISARRAVLQFASPRSHLSFLPRLDRRTVMTFENVSALLGQDDERAVVASGGRDLHKPRLPEMPEVAGTWIERTFLCVSQVASRDDTEGANGGECARLRTAQRYVTATCPDAVTFRTARQVEIPHEHVARIDRCAITWV